MVVDVPMRATYNDEKSNLQISKILAEFLGKHARNTLKRVVYNYYLRDMSAASLELPAGIFLLAYGITTGIYYLIEGYQTGIATTAGTVMLATLPIILGVQFILSFFNYDINSTPQRPFQKTWKKRSEDVLN